MERALWKRAATLAVCCLSLTRPLALVSIGNMMASDSAFAHGSGSGEPDPKLDPIFATDPFPLPAGARAERNLAYGRDPRQRLDLYTPAHAHGAPAILMVHGGGWRRGDKQLWRVVRNKVTHWVGKGYIFVSTNYRLVPEADPLAQAADVAKALEFVERHLRTWGGDPHKLILMGHSAGAHLVALLTADPSIAERAGAKPWLGSVSLDSGAMDVTQIMLAPHFRLYDEAFGSDPTYWREASALERLHGEPVAPILVVCSMRRAGSCPQGRAFAEKVERFGGRAEVLPENLSHAEINDLLGTQRPYTAHVDAFLQSLGLP
jgi:acetyl esterase/lipase